MCEKHNPKKIDECMRRLIEFIDGCEGHLKVLACCCGHSKYPMTIVIEDINHDYKYELMSGLYIGRKRKFYKKDKHGYYYIPETII